MATIEFDNLFNLDYPMAKQYLSLKEGESIVRGQVIAKQTSDDLLVAYTDADKSSNPFFGIAPDDIDATDAQIDGVEIITGCEVNSGDLIFSASGDAVNQALIDAARLKGVHIVPFISGAQGT